VDIGSAVCRASGIGDETLAAIAKHQTSDLFTDIERLALDLAEAMSATPARVTDDLRSALLAHLSPGQLAELAATIAWENHRARLNRALGVRAAGFSDGAYCVLPARPEPLSQ
jgi:alkylhydroperoxidase family enzyme